MAAQADSAERSQSRESGRITEVGLVGGGFMGSGIAEVAARAGIKVRIYEPSPEPLEASRVRIEASAKKAIDRGRLSAEDAGELLGRLEFSTDIRTLSACPLVIEAVPEREDLKASVFGELDSILAERAIIATNTSSIPIAQLAAETDRPDRVLGLHFFSPVPAMGLVEVVCALATSAATIGFAESFVEQIGKRPIRTKDRSGFIVNMLLIPYLVAAVRMYEEGFADREAIDEAMQLGCGHPMGPLALCDLIGLDVVYAVCDSLFEEFKRPEYAPPPVLKRMVALGLLGRKSGRGFYEYS